MDEVDGPDVAWVCRPQVNDRDVLVIDPPTLDVKQLSDLAIPLSPVLLCWPDDCQPQRIVVSRCRPVLQGAPRETRHPARPPLGRGELLARMNDGLTELLCGPALGFRLFRHSLRRSLSSSAKTFFSRAFSFSRLFRSDNCERPIPPNASASCRMSHH